MQRFFFVIQIKEDDFGNISETAPCYDGLTEMKKTFILEYVDKIQRSNYENDHGGANKMPGIGVGAADE